MFRSFIVVLIALLAGPALADTGGCAPIALEFNPTDTDATPDYVNLLDSTLTANGTIATGHAAEDQFMAPTNLDFSDLFVKVATAPGTTDSVITTLIVDPPGSGVAAPTSLSCTITGTATSCSPTTNKARKTTVLKGSTVTMRHTASGSPAANAVANISFCVDRSRS